MDDGLSMNRAALEPGVGERAALVVEGREISYGELAGRVSAAATWMKGRGVGRGARVALVATNRVETVVAVHALIELGATVVPVHPRLTEGEREVVLADARPHGVLGDEGLRIDHEHEHEGEGELPLAMVYTSGSTGRPKGAVLSRRAFVASAEASAANLGWQERDRWLLCMPVCHVGGLSILTRCLLARRAVILEPRFDPDAVLRSVERDRATLLSVVPTMLAALLERDERGVLRRLRAVLVGGAAAPFALLEECARRGIPALATYGLTEACSQVTVQRLAQPPVASRGSGAPLLGVEVAISAHGTILVRGPTLMSGYFRGPDLPPEPAVTAEGWFDTGDLGELDERGDLHVFSRRTDLIVTGGENVYPIEIEQRLEAQPGVRRALVFGVPDERWGQVVAAALELAGGVSLGEVVERAAGGLAAHKRPRLACAVESLPVTGPGKLVRAGAWERHRELLAPAKVLEKLS